MPKDPKQKAERLLDVVRPVVSSSYWPENDPKAKEFVEHSRLLLEKKPMVENLEWYQKDKSRRVRACICNMKGNIRDDFEPDGTQLEKLVKGRRPACHRIERKSGRVLWTDVDEDDRSEFDPCMDALPPIPGTIVREVEANEEQ